ncbi:unnamed protein product, partial [Didymodactylos carnosus]
WKIDRRLIPLLSLLYLCSFLDRINIGNAKVAGIEKDIHLTPSQYNIVVSIFFVSYGVAEAGLFPGILFYLSIWYTKRQQIMRIAIFFSSAILAGAFGGVLAYGIIKMSGKAYLTGWQWIFILEGSPVVLIGIVTYFYLPNYPETVKWLSDRERLLLIDGLKMDAGVADQSHFSWLQVKRVFMDKQVYFYALANIGNLTSFYSLSLFLPAIIHGMGYSSVQAQLMSAVPYAIAFVFTLAVSYHSQRVNERGIHVCICNLIGIVGFVLLLTVHKYGALSMYIASIIACIGTFSPIPTILSWSTNNIGGHTKRAVACGFIIAFGGMGGIVAGQSYRANDAPNYHNGHSIALSFLCLTLLSAITLKCLLKYDNYKRDNLTVEAYNDQCSQEELADWHPDFRYIT